VDWSELTDEKMTVVVYMGDRCAAIREGLLAAGRAATPVGFRAVTRRTPGRRSCDDPELVGQVDRGPAILIIGDVVAPWRLSTSTTDLSRRRNLQPAGSRRMTSPLQQKIKITGPSMVTANRTWDGIVIYRTARQDWSADIADAAIVRTSDEARALLNEANADDLGAIGAYIAPSRSGKRQDQPAICVTDPVDHTPSNFRFRRKPSAMYAYDELDRTLINERLEFRDQVAPAFRRTHRGRPRCWVAERLSATARLHVPHRGSYGTLSSELALAHVARRWDRSCSHFHRGRTSVQLIKLAELPDALNISRRRQHHAMQTSFPPVTSPDQYGSRRLARPRTPHLVRNPAPVHRCIRNSATCRASSRSPSPVPRQIAPPRKCTTSACT
jgi:hypothetical protein